MFLFMCIYPSLSKNKNKNHIYINNKKKYKAWFSILKNHILFLHGFLDLVTSLLKPWKLGYISKIPKKYILFSFNIRDYELICKIYF
jgi:hypothetical protein